MILQDITFQNLRHHGHYRYDSCTRHRIWVTNHAIRATYAHRRDPYKKDTDYWVRVRYCMIGVTGIEHRSDNYVTRDPYIWKEKIKDRRLNM